MASSITLLALLHSPPNPLHQYPYQIQTQISSLPKINPATITKRPPRFLHIARRSPNQNRILLFASKPESGLPRVQVMERGAASIAGGDAVLEMGEEVQARAR
ncbi:hypothetical protein Droror1_Dr00026828 [Drosera rotundifolia]